MSLTVETKYALRKESHKRRDAIDPSLRVAYSHLIENYLVAFIPPSSVSGIHCYISYLSEVQTHRILKTYYADGVEVSVPHLMTSDDVTFQNVKYTGEDNLVQGPYSIMQPRECTLIDPSTIDAAFIPLLAFDGFGTRLGYGKGYYDRFLRKLPRTAKKIGLAFSIQEYDELPFEPNDIPLDMIITEHGIITASKR
jgi:5-formyltetrahydrofolate cyclo-ligase